MSKKQQTQELNELSSYARNVEYFLKPDATQGIILRTPPVSELWDEEELVLAQIDGYAIIPLEAYRALKISEQLWAFYYEVGDG